MTMRSAKDALSEIMESCIDRNAEDEAEMTANHGLLGTSLTRRPRGRTFAIKDELGNAQRFTAEQP